MTGDISAPGGRPATLTLPDIAAAGRDVGMANLSVSAVANRLGVTPAALYRYVENRWGLERLIGESLLDDLTLHLDPDDNLPTLLLGVALDLHTFAIERPGLADYLLTLFPRGERSLVLLRTLSEHLRGRALQPATAIVVANAVASLAFAMAAGEERRRRAADEDPDGSFAAELAAAAQRVSAAPTLGPTITGLPTVSETDFARMLLTVAVRGVVDTLGPDPTAVEATDIITDLATAGAAADHLTRI